MKCCVVHVIIFCSILVSGTDNQAAVHCILCDFSLVLITMLLFVSFMIVFCVISIYGTDHHATIHCPHDCILYDFNLWYDHQAAVSS